ncbi:MAG: T9SS type A sorting domain-containing protein [Candidatus Kapabacteria bacterium]|nr:T9SS type A sorting domain-containing protein [Candidatus Kapabacteria bacterium]
MTVRFTMRMVMTRAGCSPTFSSLWSLCSALIILCLSFTGLSAQLAWKEFARLINGRHHHAVRYLQGDRLLVIGGYIGSRSILGGTPTNSTEIIDLATGQVSPGPSMTYTHSEFPTIVLADGDILVIGGYSIDGGNTVIERLDITTMRWITFGSLNRDRRQHVADYLSPDEVLIFGGYGESSAEILDLKTSRCRLVRTLPSAANSAVSINPDGRGPSFFGFRTGGANSPRSRESIRYMRSTDTWESDLVFDESPVAPGVAVVNDGSVLVAGGALKETPFVGSTASWIVSPLGVVRKGPSLTVGRQHLSAGTWRRDRVLVAGGLADDAVITNAVEWLDLQSMKSVRGPNLINARCYAPMIMAPNADGRLRAFVVSGLGPEENTPLVEVLEDSVCFPAVTDQQLSDMRLVGSAKYREGAIGLTSTAQYESGGAFLRNRVAVRNGFDLTFSFRLSDGNDNGMVDEGDPGADGVAVVFLPETPTAVGQPGDGIGYHEIPHGIAVEYDSYLNPAYSDPNTSHVAVQVGDGRLLRAWHMPPYGRGVAAIGVPRFKADGSVYHGRISYSAGKLLVYVSTTGQFDEPVLEVDSFDIQKILNLDSRGSCYVGFTSSTGRSSEVHELLSVELTDCQPVTSVLDAQKGLYRPVRLTVVPNPVTVAAQVHFSLPLQSESLLELVDVHGRVIQQFTIPAGATSQSLDAISTIASGMYTVRLATQDGVISSPLTILR